MASIPRWPGDGRSPTEERRVPSLQKIYRALTPNLHPAGNNGRPQGKCRLAAEKIRDIDIMDNNFNRVGIAFFLSVTVLTLLVTLYTSWL